MSGPKEQWLLLHGTPLTPQVWDGVTGYLQDSDLAGRLPQATTHILAGAAHMTPFTHPARLAMLLTRSARS